MDGNNLCLKKKKKENIQENKCISVCLSVASILMIILQVHSLWSEIHSSFLSLIGIRHHFAVLGSTGWESSSTGFLQHLWGMSGRERGVAQYRDPLIPQQKRYKGVVAWCVQYLPLFNRSGGGHPVCNGGNLKLRVESCWLLGPTVLVWGACA